MISEIKRILKENKDEVQAAKMAAYMKDNFDFAGISKPKLSSLIRPLLKETAKEPLNWEFVFSLWEEPYREAQYIALEYIKKHHRELMPYDIGRLHDLIISKSWWETVDTIDAFVGEIVQKDESLKDEMRKWAVSENMWLRRTAIDFQQEYKENTDEELLEEIIVKNLGSKEFFINKAIGWSLRDYSKVNPDWVRVFVDKYKDNMAALSIKEALKYIKQG